MITKINKFSNFITKDDKSEMKVYKTKETEV